MKAILVHHSVYVNIYIYVYVWGTDFAELNNKNCINFKLLVGGGGGGGVKFTSFPPQVSQRDHILPPVLTKHTVLIVECCPPTLELHVVKKQHRH